MAFFKETKKYYYDDDDEWEDIIKIPTNIVLYDIMKNFIRRDVLLSNTTVKVPNWEKSNLTIEETAAYSGIGINKIREMSNTDNCPFVLWVGKKRLIKRKKFDEFIEHNFSI